MENYDVGQVLGRGGFATVYRARVRGSGQEVAVKMLEKSRMAAAGMTERVVAEVKLHWRLRHPNVVQLLEFFEDKQCVYMVMELCAGGDLYRQLRARKCFNEDESKALVAQILSGLAYLHSHGIIHRDLKLSNLLLTSEGVLKIADFGLAVKLEHDDEEHFTICGTPNYIAPEIASEAAHGLPADLWAVGCLFYTLVAGKAPFQGTEASHTLANAKKGVYQEPKDLSFAGRHFLQNLLQRDPSKRLTVKDVQAHPFLTGKGLDELAKDGTGVLLPPGETVTQATTTLPTHDHGFEDLASVPTISGNAHKSDHGNGNAQTTGLESIHEVESGVDGISELSSPPQRDSVAISNRDDGKRNVEYAASLSSNKSNRERLPSTSAHHRRRYRRQRPKHWSEDTSQEDRRKKRGARPKDQGRVDRGMRSLYGEPRYSDWSQEEGNEGSVSSPPSHERSGSGSSFSDSELPPPPRGWGWSDQAPGRQRRSKSGEYSRPRSLSGSHRRSRHQYRQRLSIYEQPFPKQWEHPGNFWQDLSMQTPGPTSFPPWGMMPSAPHWPQATPHPSHSPGWDTWKVPNSNYIPVADGIHHSAQPNSKFINEGLVRGIYGNQSAHVREDDFGTSIPELTPHQPVGLSEPGSNARSMMGHRSVEAHPNRGRHNYPVLRKSKTEPHFVQTSQRPKQQMKESYWNLLGLQSSGWSESEPSVPNPSCQGNNGNRSSQRDQRKTPGLASDMFSIDCARLLPSEHDCKLGRVFINKEDGWVILKCRKLKMWMKVRGYEIKIKKYISSSMRRKSLQEKTYGLSNLPFKYHSTYKYIHQVVQMVRSRTPKVILYLQKYNVTVKSTQLTAKCMLMENSPLPDFIVKWLDKARLNYSLQSGFLNFSSENNSFRWAPEANDPHCLKWPTEVPTEISHYLISAQKAMHRCLEIEQTSMEFPISVNEQDSNGHANFQDLDDLCKNITDLYLPSSLTRSPPQAKQKQTKINLTGQKYAEADQFSRTSEVSGQEMQSNPTNPMDGLSYSDLQRFRSILEIILKTPKGGNSVDKTDQMSFEHRFPKEKNMTRTCAGEGHNESVMVSKIWKTSEGHLMSSFSDSSCITIDHMASFMKFSFQDVFPEKMNEETIPLKKSDISVSNALCKKLRILENFLITYRIGS